MTPGEQLRRWRADRKLSMDAACRPVRVNKSTWWDAEHGIRCTAETARRILSATGIQLQLIDGSVDRRPPAVGEVGKALRAWRDARGLSMAEAGALCGCSATPFRTLERGGHVVPETAKAILTLTGITVPAANNRHNATWSMAAAAAKQRPSRHCRDCCGLPHRRPAGKPCRCGEAWAPDVVQHPVPGLRSSASWCGDYADAEAE